MRSLRNVGVFIKHSSERLKTHCWHYTHSTHRPQNSQTVRLSTTIVYTSLCVLIDEWDICTKEIAFLKRYP